MIGAMAHRINEKIAARAAREAQTRRVAQTHARRRLTWLGLLVLAAATTVALVVAFGSSGPRPTTAASPSAAATVNRLLAGIPESGTTLGSPSAPVTITEYGDLVCPVCAAFATTSETQLIASYVRSGRVKLVFRGLETASASHNADQFVNTIVSVRSAGLQRRAWYYVELAYHEQPQTIGGVPAEDVSYVTPAYLQRIAQQVPGLSLASWQANTAAPALAAAVAADQRAAQAAGIDGTPTEIVSGPRGSVQYDRSGTLSAVPTLEQLAQLIAQVG
jgi:protein-disulfide isomerase